MKKIIIITAAALSIHFGEAEELSAGGLFLEPSVTLELGSGTVDYPEPYSKTTGSINGFGLGGRIGFHILESFFLGVDGRFALPLYNDSSVSYESYSTGTNWGPVVGGQMPHLGVRLWGGLILGGELDPRRGSIIDVKFDKPEGYRLGAGFRVEAISINLEYQNLKYGGATLQSLGPFETEASFSGVNLGSTTWVASVSFPIEI